MQSCFVSATACSSKVIELIRPSRQPVLLDKSRFLSRLRASTFPGTDDIQDIRSTAIITGISFTHVLHQIYRPKFGPSIVYAVGRLLIDSKWFIMGDVSINAEIPLSYSRTTIYSTNFYARCSLIYRPIIISHKRTQLLHHRLMMAFFWTRHVGANQSVWFVH